MVESIKYQTFLPPFALKDLVNYYWVFEGDFGYDHLYIQPTAASTFPKLSFQYEGMLTMLDDSNQKFNIKSGLQGQTNKFLKIISNQKVGVVGVCFFPQALPLLFNIAASEITNYNLEISDVLGSDGKQLENKIIETNNNTDRIKILSEFLLKKVNRLNKNKLLFAPAIHFLLQSRGKISMNQVASQFCLSQRQFERKFKEYSGFSPKMFSRIARFENCLSYGFGQIQSFTELAYFAGFYDQSHFFKDVKEFTGKNPKEYFSNELSFFFK